MIFVNVKQEQTHSMQIFGKMLPATEVDIDDTSVTLHMYKHRVNKQNFCIIFYLVCRILV